MNHSESGSYFADLLYVDSFLHVFYNVAYIGPKNYVIKEYTCLYQIVSSCSPDLGMFLLSFMFVKGSVQPCISLVKWMNLLFSKAWSCP